MSGYLPIEDLADLHAAMNGFRISRALQIANFLEIFTYLAEGPKTLDELASDTEVKSERLERLLMTCCAMGLLKREADRFENTPVADKYLVKDRDCYQGHLIAHGMHAWKRWDDMPRHYTSEKHQPGIEGPREFVLGMHDLAMSGQAAHLVEHVDLTGRRRLLDVGGGPGSYSVALCRKYPELRATVWDLEPALEVARALVAQYPDVEDRIHFGVGDWNTDEFGSGYDTVLLSNVLHGAGSHAMMKLQKAHRALSPGGLLIIHDFMLNDDRDGPLSGALFHMYIGAYSYFELSRLARRTGFTDCTPLPPYGDYGCAVLTAVKA